MCTDFRYGEECNKTCNCGNQTEVCDKRTGRCTSGCPDGWTGAACDESTLLYIFFHYLLGADESEYTGRL